jgi:phenylpropionate dioxygenase-like ring-hydroxylating dioxygenase large terminal subunit
MEVQAKGAALSSPYRYISDDVAAQERERLFPKVWLMACRVEQLEKPGDFVTFDIARETILLIRTDAATIKAFYNICQHRGRRLKEGCGNTGKSIFCPFHGWRWKIDGQFERAINSEDWANQPGFFDDKNLPELRIDTWAGWVFVSMDPDIEPLLDYLAPVPDYIDPFELENCRISWGITIRFPCNWKTVVNAFNENYHVETTHPQLNKFGLSKAPAFALGKHSHFKIEQSAGTGSGQNLGNATQFKDMIETIEYREGERMKWLNSLTTEYSLGAAKALRDAVAADAPAAEIMAKFREMHRANLEAAGAKWPDKVTSEVIMRAGIDWHVFPNFLFLPNIDGALVYRARPDPNDPESCWYDVWWLQRYGEDNVPPYEHTTYQSLDEAAGVNPFLEQDFSNLQGVQRGIHSRGFKGAAYNPVQEVEIINFEQNLDRYLYGDGLDHTDKP